MNMYYGRVVFAFVFAFIFFGQVFASETTIPTNLISVNNKILKFNTQSTLKKVNVKLSKIYTAKVVKPKFNMNKSFYY